MEKNINKILRKNDAELLEKKNVVGVGVGPKNGDGEESIVVLVEKKESLSALDEGNMIPESIDGVKTDVIETGPIVPLAKGQHADRCRPVFGGISAIWKKGTACTLGAIVWKDGKPYALMNTHCGIPHWKGAKVGDDIVQPSPNDGGRKTGSRDVIGKSTEMYKELILDGQTPNKFDACLVELDKDIDVKELYLEGIGEIEGRPATVSVGEEVTKSGRTTGVGSAKVLLMNATVRVDYGSGVGVFPGQIIVENNNEHFTAGGDSSSLVINKEKRPVGQIYAGSDTIGIFCPIQPIMDEFGFSFSKEPLPPETETVFKFTRTLKRGDTGIEVKMAQQWLKDRGFFPDIYATTEYFGPVTERSVQAFQCKYGLVCSGTPQTTGYGQIGPKTRALMNAMSQVGPKPDVELYPVVKKLRETLAEIMDATGNPIFVTDEYRSIEEQDELYAQGRTKPGAIVTNAKGGESFHNWRCAFDIAFVKKDGSDPYVGPWDMVGRIGEAIGLEWGGKWTSIVDRPHFQFTAGYSIDDFKNGRIDEEKFGVTSTKNLSNNNVKTSMTNDTKRHLKSSAALVGTGAIILPLLATLLEGLAEVMNLPVFQAQIESWFGVGTLASILVLTLAYRVVAYFLNYLSAKKEGISASSASDSVKI